MAVFSNSYYHGFLPERSITTQTDFFVTIANAIILPFNYQEKMYRIEKKENGTYLKYFEIISIKMKLN